MALCRCPPAGAGAAPVTSEDGGHGRLRRVGDIPQHDSGVPVGGGQECSIRAANPTAHTSPPVRSGGKSDVRAGCAGSATSHNATAPTQGPDPGPFMPADVAFHPVASHLPSGLNATALTSGDALRMLFRTFGSRGSRTASGTGCSTSATSHRTAEAAPTASNRPFGLNATVCTRCRPVRKLRRTRRVARRVGCARSVISHKITSYLRPQASHCAELPFPPSLLLAEISRCNRAGRRAVINRASRS